MQPESAIFLFVVFFVGLLIGLMIALFVGLTHRSKLAQKQTELDHLTQRSDSVHAVALNQLRSDYESKLQQQKLDGSGLVSKLTSEYEARLFKQQNDMTAMKGEHDNKLQQQQQEASERVLKMVNDYEARLLNQRNEADRQMSQTQEKWADQLAQEKATLNRQIAELEASLKTEREKNQWLQDAHDVMKNQFASLATETLRQTSTDFLSRADGTMEKQRAELDQLVKPLNAQVTMLSTAVQALEGKREAAYADLSRQVTQLAATHQQLQASTSQLSQAMKSSSARGQWGELQLRRIVELAGMKPHVDFNEQMALDDGRPDMVIHLPNYGDLAVDSKAPMSAYLAAIESATENERKTRLSDHARSVRGHVNTLKQRRYAASLKNAPQFVVMFMPNEACLSAAFEADSELLDYALREQVLITTPITLMALLKSAAYGWQQQELAQNANQIADKGRELFERMQKFAEHLTKLRKNLVQSVDAFNDTVGSLEGRVMPAARDLGRMTSGKELSRFDPIDGNARLLTIAD
ncbi:MAG: DNA recombination protein RmuC [Anaerolineae bacterium]|nr:DNA recombination protein RmuC [Anaerolineae bacterium]